MIICSLADRWRSLGLGFVVDAFCLSAICYADDIILVAHSAEHLALMIEDIVGKLKEIGLGIGAEKNALVQHPSARGCDANH